MNKEINACNLHARVLITATITHMLNKKNWTHVRQLFGYERFSNQAVVALMNDLYKNEISWMNNYFLPNTKLKEKQRVESRVLKKHDKPATPYQRLMNSTHISEQKKKELTEIYNNLNPFELKKNIKRKLDQIFRLINRDNGKKICYI